MSTHDIITTFNRYSEEFIDEMILVSRDTDAVNYKTILINLNKSNCTKCIEQFILYILPNKEYINASDEKYFIEKNYSDQLENDDYSLLKALKIKDMWVTFTPDTKRCIFEYLQVMVYYSEEYLKHKLNISTI